MGGDKEKEGGRTARLLHRDSASTRECVHGEMESEKRRSENYSSINASDTAELPGGGGEGSHSGAGSHGRDTESGGRSGVDADHGVGGTSGVA
jgi:hypothetical protein